MPTVKKQADILTHVLLSATLVWLLPDFMLVGILSYLTYSYPTSRKAVNKLKERALEMFIDDKKKDEERRDSVVGSFIKKHYNTLKGLIGKVDTQPDSDEEE